MALFDKAYHVAHIAEWEWQESFWGWGTPDVLPLQLCCSGSALLGGATAHPTAEGHGELLSMSPAQKYTNSRGSFLLLINMNNVRHYLSHTLEEAAIFSKGQGSCKSKAKYSSMFHLRILNHLYQACHYFNPYSSDNLHLCRFGKQWYNWHSKPWVH